MSAQEEVNSDQEDQFLTKRRKSENPTEEPPSMMEQPQWMSPQLQEMVQGVPQMSKILSLVQKDLSFFLTHQVRSLTDQMNQITSENVHLRHYVQVLVNLQTGGDPEKAKLLFEQHNLPIIPFLPPPPSALPPMHPLPLPPAVAAPPQEEAWQEAKKKPKKEKKPTEKPLAGVPQPMKNETSQKPKATTYAAAAASKPPQKLSPATRFKKSVEAKAKEPEKADDLLQLLVVSPKENSLQEVQSTIFSIKLTMKARQSPTLAWNALVKAWCGHPPLQVSLLAPGKAEIFYDPKHHELIMEGALRLRAEVHSSGLSNRDFQRRARAYLNGYFRPLRLAALNGFEIDQREAVLELAKAMIPQRFKSSKEHQNLWQRNIEFDQEQLSQLQAQMEV